MSSIYKQTLCFTMKLLFAGEIVTSKLSICRATLNIVHISKTVRCSFSWLIKAATNAPRINLIGYVCCLKWQKSSVQYWTFVCRETLQKNKFWLHHLIIRSQALGRLRPGFRFYWNSSVSHNQEGLCLQSTNRLYVLPWSYCLLVKSWHRNCQFAVQR